MPPTDWHGIRDDLTIVGTEGMQEAQNCSFRIQGELRRRPGLGTKLAAGGVLSSEFTDRLGNTYLATVSSGGAIQTINLTDLSTNTLKSSLSMAYRGMFARSNQRLYYTDDFDQMQMVELGNVAAAAAGIAAPTTGAGVSTIGTPSVTGAGLVDIGTRAVRYRYYNSRSGYFSNPSYQLSVTTTGADTFLFSIGSTTGSTVNIYRSTDTKVDQVVVEMTLAGASEFYQAAVVNQTLSSVSVSMNDTTLALQTAVATYGDFGHEQPPLFSLLTEHRGRLFGWGATIRAITGATVTLSSTTVTVTGSTFSTNWAGRMVQLTTGSVVYRIASVTDANTIVLSTNYSGATNSAASLSVYSNGADTLYWSRAGYPEAWKPSEWARRVLQNASDAPAGMVSMHDVLWLFGQRTMRVLDYPTDPATGSLEQVPTEMGLWNQRCLVTAGGQIFGWGRSGAWSLNGLSPVHISRPIDDRLNGVDATSTVLYDAAYSEKFFGYYDPKERCLTWAYVKSGDTTAKYHVTYDLDRKEWRTGSWRQAMNTATLVGGTTNDTRVLLSDENSLSWYLTDSRFDGVPTTLVNSGSEYTGVVTVATTGATATLIQVDQTLPTSPSLSGVVLYNPTTSATAVVSSNTASSITLVGTGLTAAPSYTDSLYLGSIEWKMRLKWVDGEGLQTKKRPSYLLIKKVPGSTVGKLRVRIYQDFSTTPFTFTRGLSDTEPDGVGIVDGLTYVDVDMDTATGNESTIWVPLGADWKRAVTADVSSNKPVNILRILEVRFVSQSERSEVEVSG